MKRVRISEMTPQQRVDFAVSENFTLDMCERYNVDLELLTKAIAKAKMILTTQAIRVKIESVVHKLSIDDTMKDELLTEKKRLESDMTLEFDKYFAIARD